MLRLLLLIIGLIVYGSLYPWRFSGSTELVPALRDLLSGNASTFYARDALVNVFFYVPVGACAYLALRLRVRAGVAAAAAVALGIALSTCVEVAQGFEVSRRTSIYDVYANSFGSVIGVAVAAVFSQTGMRLKRREGSPRADFAALALIACWISYLVFPFLPTLTGRAMGVGLAQARSAGLLSVASASVAWFVMGKAFQAAGVPRAALVCLASTTFVLAQVLVLPAKPILADFAGAVAGALAFAFAQRRTWGATVAAVAIVALLVARGLTPFRIVENAKDFGWVPFAPLLTSDWYRATQVLSTKLFFYAAAVWTLRSAGLRLRSASLITAAVLLAVELVQRRLPVHTPEVTDSLLALMIGIGFDAFGAEPRRTSNPSGTSA